MVRAWRCAAAAVAIVTSVPAAAADALREVCMRATSLRWTQLRAWRHENLEVASEQSSRSRVAVVFTPE